MIRPAKIRIAVSCKARKGDFTVKKLTTTPLHAEC